MRRRHVVIALGGAVVLASALIAVSVLSRSTGEATDVAAAIEPSPLLRGIPQDGIVLGHPDAPVTLVEYADLQCPFCAQWARDAFPTLVDEYVRTGRVRVVFRGLTFLGPDSETALRAAMAAGEQDRLWDVVHGLFVRQGAENTGWVTDELLRSFGGAGVDTMRMLDRTGAPEVERKLAAAQREADAAGVRGTPSFQIGRTGGRLEQLHVTALDADTFRRELDRALAG